MRATLCGSAMVGLIAVLCATSAAGTTVVPFSADRLVADANLIVEGRCVEIYSEWIDGHLVTQAVLDVDHQLKGANAAPSQLTVVLPGGVDLDREVPIQVTYPGVPRVTLDEEVLLFLVPYTARPGSYTVLGLAQGKFTIVQDAGTKRVRRDLEGLRFLGGTPPASSVEGQDLETVRRAITESLARQSSASTG